MTTLPAWATDYLTKHLAILTEGLQEAGHLQPYQRLHWDVTPLRDPEDYCTAHGGTLTGDQTWMCEDVDHDEAPPPLPPCTCQPLPQAHAYRFPYGHQPACPQHIAPLTLPVVSVSRGGITYPRSDT